MKISKQDYAIIKRVLSLLKPYTKKIVGIIICIIISAGIGLIMPLISRTMMDEGLLKSDFALVVYLSLFTLLLLIIEQGISIIETKYLSYIHSVMNFTLSKMAFKKSLKLNMDYFKNANFMEIMSNINMDAGNISRISDRSTFFIIAQVFRLIGGMAGLLLINWKLTILVTIIIPPRYILVKYFARKRRKMLEEYIEHNREFSSWYGDTMAGIKEVKLWGLDQIKIGEYIRKRKKLVKFEIKLALLDKFNEFSEAAAARIMSNALYIIGTYMIFFPGSLTIGGLMAFITYSSYVTNPIYAILNIGYSFSNIIPSAKRYFEFLDMKSEAELEGDNKIRIYSSDKVVGNISFENVSFAYKEGENVLNNISFEVRKGEKIAIVGSNGSGKSTIINLILRFCNASKGRILLDGINIEDIKLKDYRSLISIVSQEFYLFNTDIKKNIALNSRASEEEIYRASRKSGADKFITALQDKYSTNVGNNGMRLSGGERQKVAMARAFVKNSKLLILDEATSNYDYESEYQVNQLLGNEFNDKAIIVITHKPDILKQMDKVILLSNGKIKDIGTHEELYTKDSFYKEMVSQEANLKGVS